MTKILIKVAVIALFAGAFATEGMAHQSTSHATNSSSVLAVGVGTTYGASGGLVLGNSESDSRSKGGNSGAASGSAGGLAGGVGVKGKHNTSMTAGFAAGGVTSSASTN